MSEGLAGLILLGAAGLPLAFFDLAFLQSPAGIVALCALLAGCALWLRRYRSGQSFTPATVALCFGLAICLCLLGGEMHVFSPTDDWFIRDAVLHDLVDAPWPVHYAIDGKDYLLRAPLGIYLVPAAIGKIFGLAAAHAALFLQNAAILGCLFLIFTAAAKSTGERILILSIFTIFSGLDILGLLGKWLIGTAPPFQWHIEAWVDGMQYSSHLTQLFWVPHHALAGWGFVAAYLCWRRGALSAWSLAAIFSLCLFWSPLAMMGALPFLIFAFWTDWRMRRLDPHGLWVPLLIGIGALPAAAYLMMDSSAIEQGLNIYEPNFVLRYGQFILIELALWFWIFLSNPNEENGGFTRGDIAAAALSLLLFPFYFISFSNDFTMRASIPALAIVALAAAPRVGAMFHVPGMRRALLAGGLALAAITPGIEVTRALILPTTALGTCTLPHTWTTWAREIAHRDAPMKAYLADPLAGRMRDVLAPQALDIAGDAPCGQRIFAFPFMDREARTATLAPASGQAP